MAITIIDAEIGDVLGTARKVAKMATRIVAPPLMPVRDPGSCRIRRTPHLFLRET